MTALLQIRTDWKTRIQQKVQLPFDTAYGNEVLIDSEENDLMPYDYSGNAINSQPLTKRITL